MGLMKEVEIKGKELRKGRGIKERKEREKKKKKLFENTDEIRK